MRAALALSFVLTVAATALATRMPPESWLRWLYGAAVLGAVTAALFLGVVAELLLRKEDEDRRWTALPAALAAAYALGYRFLGELPAGLVPEGPLAPAISLASIAALVAAVAACAYGWFATGASGRLAPAAGALALLCGLLALGPTLQLAGLPSVGPVTLTLLAVLAAVATLLGRRRRRPSGEDPAP